MWHIWYCINISIYARGRAISVRSSDVGLLSPPGPDKGLDKMISMVPQLVFTVWYVVVTFLFVLNHKSCNQAGKQSHLIFVAK